MPAGKMFSYVNQTLHVTLADGRNMTGTMIAFDKHMNLVLSDVEETRPLSKKVIEPRKLGLVMVRGEHVISVRAERKHGDAPMAGSGVGAGEGVAVPAQPKAVPVLPGGRK
jgi:small nuclear ribonucleoprotein B and B'